MTLTRRVPSFNEALPYRLRRRPDDQDEAREGRLPGGPLASSVAAAVARAIEKGATQKQIAEALGIDAKRVRALRDLAEGAKEDHFPLNHAESEV
jgi:DNA-binding NarL/FixJ family response regulator